MLSSLEYDMQLAKNKSINNKKILSSLEYDMQLANPQPTQSTNNGGFFGGLGYAFEKIGLGFLSGIEGIWDYTAGGLADLFGADEWAEEQFANNWVNYNDADEWFNPEGGWKVVGDVAGGIGSSLPAIAAVAGAAAVTYFSGGSLSAPAWGTAAKIIGVGTAGLSAAGQSTREAYQKTGQLTGKEFGYGALSGIAEAGMEYITAGMGAGIGRVTNKIASSASKEAVKNTSKSLAKKVVTNGLLKEFGAEAFEEGMQEILDPYFQRWTDVDPNAQNATAQQIAYSALVGGLSGVLMGGTTDIVGNTIGTARATIRGNNISKNADSTQNVINMSRELAEYENQHNTGEPIYKSAKSLIEKYDKYDDGSGKLTTRQKTILGQLAVNNTAQIFSEPVKRSKENIKANAQEFIKAINERNIIDGTTGEPFHFNSVDELINNDSLLTQFAVGDVIGKFMLSKDSVYDFAMGKGRNATLMQADFRNFQKNASIEQKQAINEALNIDVDSIAFEDFINKIQTTPRVNVESHQKAIEIQKKAKTEIRRLKNTNAEVEQLTDRAVYQEGMNVFKAENGDLVPIYKEGKEYYIFDGNRITKPLTLKELKDIVKGMVGNKNTKPTQTKANTSQNAPINTNVNENINANIESANNNVDTRVETQETKDTKKTPKQPNVDTKPTESTTSQETKEKAKEPTKAKPQATTKQEKNNSVEKDTKATTSKKQVESNEDTKNIQNVSTKTEKSTKKAKRQFAVSSFSKQVDNVINGTHNPNYDLYVSKTPSVLLNIGLEDKPLLMRNSKIKEILEKHPEMSVEIIKQIPNAIADPVMVIKSKTHPNESVVVITDVKTSKGEMILPVWVNQKSNYLDVDFGNSINENANFVASAYGRNNKLLIEYALNNNEVLFYAEDKKRVSSLLATHGLQLPARLSMTNFNNSILKNKENVNKNLKNVEKDTQKKQFAITIGGEQANVDIQDGKNLVALHNLSSEKLLKVLDLGGFPMPSIAVTRTDIAHNEFGDISVVFGKDTIDPQKDSRNKVYSRDAWTPIAPIIEYKTSEEVRSRIYKKYSELMPEFGEKAKVLYGYANYLEDKINRDGGIEKTLNSLYENTDLMELFLYDTQKKRINPIIDEKVTELSKEEIETSKKIISILGEDKIKESSSLIFRKYNEFIEANKDAILDGLSNGNKEVRDFYEENADIKKAVRKAANFFKDGQTRKVEKVFNSTATKQAITSAVDMKEYKNWVDNLFDGAVEKRGIRNNIDPYTSSGNAKRWETLHEDVTLDNIVKLMKQDNEKGNSFFNGITPAVLAAKLSKEFKSINQIKQDSNSIKVFQDEMKTNFNENAGNIIHEISELMVDKSQFSENLYYWQSLDGAQRIIGEIADKKLTTEEQISAYMRKEYKNTTIKYSPEIGKKILSLFDYVRQFTTTDYFESKPRRAVGLNEIKRVLLPSDTDTKLINELEKRNIPYLTYDKTQENARQEIIKGLDNVRFAVSESEQTVPNGSTSQQLKPLEMRRAENYLTNNLPGYSRLTQAEKLEVEWTLASGWRNGKSNAEILDLAKLSSAIGVGIGFANITAQTDNGANVNVDAACYTRGGHLTIYLNPNTQRTIECATLHELTHSLEGMQGYDELRSMAEKYYKDHPEEKKAIDNRYREVYKNEQVKYENEILPSELTAHYIESMIGNRNVIAELTKAQPTLVQKCIDKLKSIKDKFLGKGGKNIDEIDILINRFKFIFNQNKDKIGKGLGTTKYAFAGEKAKTADKLKLSTAESMLKSGISSEKIRQETGWFKGTDGKWRFEIDDSSFSVKKTITPYKDNETRIHLDMIGYKIDSINNYIKESKENISIAKSNIEEYLKNGGSQNSYFYTQEMAKIKSNKLNIQDSKKMLQSFESELKQYQDKQKTVLSLENEADIDKLCESGAVVNLGDFVSHKQLFDAYPSLTNIPVSFSNTNGHYDAMVTHKGSQMLITVQKSSFNNIAKLEKNIIHELQHTVQNIEGFARGTNLDEAKTKLNQKINDLTVKEKSLSEKWQKELSRLEVKFIENAQKQGKPENYLESADAEKDFDLLTKQDKEYAKVYKQYMEATIELANAKKISPLQYYLDTAGEVESRDVENRLKLSQDERIVTRPNIDRKVVFAENSNVISATEKVDVKDVVNKLKNAIPNLQNDSPVAILTGNEFSQIDNNKLSTQVVKYFKEIGSGVNRDGFGFVNLNNKGVKCDIAHGLGRAKAFSFKAVPEVIKFGKQIDYQRNWKNRGYDTYIFAAPVKVGTEIDYVAVVVKSGDNNSLDLHEIVNSNGDIIIIKKDGDSPSFKTTSDAETHITGKGKSPSTTTNIRNNSQNVNTFEKKLAISTKDSKIDNYTEKQYNNYGWVVKNEVLSTTQYKDFNQKLGQLTNKQSKFTKTKNGEYIIPVNDMKGDSFGVDNTLVYVKGTYQNPKINQVVKILLGNETAIDIVRSEIYESKGIFREDYFKGILEVNRAEDFSRRSTGRATNGQSSKVNGLLQNGTRITGKTTTNVKFALSENIEQDVVKEFGTTYNWKETGYLLQDGTRIDLSGKIYGARPGSRTVDHREIFDCYDIDGSDAMVEFMGRGNIRVSPEYPGINIQVEPTEQQYKMIQDLVERLGWKEEYFSVDFDNKNGDTIDNLSYEGKVSARKVIADIKYYFKEGKIPQQSELAKFRYAITKDDIKGGNLVMETMPNDRISIKDVFTRQEKPVDLIKQVLADRKEWTTDWQVLTTNAQAGIEKVLKQKGVENAEAITNYVRAGKNAGQAALTVGQYSLDNETYMGESWQEIWQPIYNLNKKDSKAYGMFQAYLLHWHNIDRYAVGKPVFGENVTDIDSKAEIAKIEAEYPMFKKQAEKVWKFNDNNLQIAVESGLYSQEYAKELREIYPHYVPTLREEHQQGISTIQGKGNIRVNPNKKKATGSDLNILPIDNTVAQQTIQRYSAARTNQMLLKLADGKPNSEFVIVGGVESVNADIDTDTLVTTKQNTYTNQITFWKDGKSVTANVSKNIFRGIESFAPSGDTVFNNAIVNAVSKANTLFKKAVTAWNPFFVLFKNPIRDMQTALNYTRYSWKTFAKNYTRAMSEIKSNGKYWMEAQAAGILSSTVYDYRKGLQYNGMGKWAKIKHKLESLSNLIEMAPRMAEYISARESGLSVQEALLQAQDLTTNFGRGGTFTKKMNSTIMPFLNPAVQGFSKMIRAYGGKDAAKSWLSLIIRSIILGFGLTALNDLVNDDDEDYQNLSDHIKQSNYVLAVGDGQFLKIPKGRENGFIGELYLRARRSANGEENAWEDVAKSFVSNLTPTDNFTRTIFSPLLDIKTNSTWYGGTIEGQKWNNTEPKNRYDETTSNISIWLGKVFNYSPIKIDYLLNQYGGILADIALPATTLKVQEGIVSQNMLVNPINNSKWSTEFYSQLEKYNYKKTDGDLNAKGVVKFLNGINDTISDLNKQKKDIQASKDLSANEKLTQVKIIQATINALEKDALTNAKIMNNELSKYDLSTDEQFETGYFDSLAMVCGEEYALQKYNKKVYEKANNLNKLGIEYGLYYDYYFGIKDIESDKDRYGNTISGSKKAKVIQYTMQYNIPLAQKLMLIMSVGNKINDGDIKGVSKKFAQNLVARHIKSLKVPLAEKVELAELCGFTVKNGKIIFD